MVAAETTDVEPFLRIIFDRFAATPADSIANAIDATLEEIARFSGANAAWVREQSAERQRFSTVHRWRRSDLEPPAAHLVEEAPPGLATILLRGDSAEMADVARDSTGTGLDATGFDAGSLLEVPVRSDRGVVGSAGLLRVQARRWSRAENVLLRAAAAAIGQALRRQKAERERRQLERRLRRGERLEAVGRLAAGVAHDFNNILLAIGGFAHLAEKSSQPTARSEAFREIDNAIVRARRLTQQLLAFSGRTPIDKARVDLNEVVKSMGAILDRLVPSHVELSIDCSASPAAILADTGHLEQILVNLCVNARDAMPDGGRLSVSTRSSNGEGAEWVELTVEDTGTGFDDDVRAHLFDPFFTTKGEGEGTGLGLATVRELVDGYGGSIDVASTPGQGSRFVIRLPAFAGETTPIPADDYAPHDGALSAATARILLADDEPALLRSIAQILQSGGHDVTTASDGAEAIELLERRGHELDVVIVDVAMPKASGVQVADAVRALRPELPVVLTTGYRDARLDHLTRRERTTVLSKPFSSRQLLRLVGDLLAGPKSERPPS